MTAVASRQLGGTSMRVPLAVNNRSRERTNRRPGSPSSMRTRGEDTGRFTSKRASRSWLRSWYW